MQAASVRFRPDHDDHGGRDRGHAADRDRRRRQRARRAGRSGIVVVGGLAFSQIVTLYVTPVFYTYLDELQGWLGRAGHCVAPAAGTARRARARGVATRPYAARLIDPCRPMTTLFIKRPVMTTLVMIAILFFGIVAYTRLPVSDLPNVDYPTITVTRHAAGRQPADDGATVATPLEKQFSTIAGIDNMTSTSAASGQTQIVVQFALDRNIDAAAQDVQAAITQTLRTLPQGIIPPSYQKTNPAATRRS